MEKQQLSSANLGEVRFDPTTGLVPAIVQDDRTRHVLMQGYMNREAIEKTLAEGKVTFFSRSKQRLWMKGETSGNTLDLVSISADCDRDSLLVRANPNGPTCHTGADTCWNEENRGDFLEYLETIIHNRRDNPSDESYTASLFKKGINKVAQKVGEEAVELVIEAKDDDKDLFLNEAADLMYHYIVLLAAKDYTLEDVKLILRSRHS